MRFGIGELVQCLDGDHFRKNALHALGSNRLLECSLKRRSDYNMILQLWNVIQLLVHMYQLCHGTVFVIGPIIHALLFEYPCALPFNFFVAFGTVILMHVVSHCVATNMSIVITVLIGSPLVIFQFRYATAGNVFLMLIGSFCACANGIVMPSLFILLGRMMDTFVNSALFHVVINRVDLEQFNLTAEETKEDPSLLQHLYPLFKNITNGYLDLEAHPEAPTYDIMPDMIIFATYTGISACVVIFLGYAQVAFWRIAAENQVHRIRLLCFRNLMRQEISYFDCRSSGEINNRLLENVTQIEAGIGDTVGTLLQWLSSAVSGYVLGFYYGWEYALVLLCGSPLQALSTFLLVKVASNMTIKEINAYSKAGAIAQEALKCIRTVVAFGGESVECERYDEHIAEARRCGEKKGLIIGFAIGFTWCMKYLVYALGIWYGARILIYEQHTYSTGALMTVFLCMSFASFALGFMLPSIESITTARTAAYTVFEMIRRVSEIDSSSETGLQPKACLGDIEICNVHFHYPTRPGALVLKGINLYLNSGETLALVGSTGCGKTTIAQLLLRFYDPINGQVLCDGTDIQELNVKWFRHQIGIVSQEPVLFSTTISENIRHGWDNVSYGDIERAANMANVHSFIMTLPRKYDTLVGEGGCQLSGGQKQRIAIARALIRDPKILLLDEATASMDAENEAIVQEAIDRASIGRTTLIIAHRLSTIRSADKIAAIEGGVIAELGTHDDLMAKNGVYKNLIMSQMEAISEDQEILDQKQEFVGKIDVSLYDYETNEGKVESGKEKQQKIHASALMGLFRMNAREWPYIVAGCFACLISGAVQPAFGVILSSSFTMFQLIDNDERFRQSRWYSLAFVVISAVALVSMTLKSYLFAKSGEALTMKIRQKLFKTILYQDIGWFDNEENNTGVLTHRLMADASQVHGITGVRLGLVLQSISSLGIGLGVAMYYGWKLALVILAFVPFIVFAAMFEMIIIRGASGKNDQRVEKAGEIANEAIDSIRTVAMLSREDYFYERYKAKLKGDNSPCLRRSHLTGLSFSLTQSLLYLSYCATFTYGGYLIQSGEMVYQDVFRVFIVISLSAIDIGKSNVFVPNVTKAKESAAKIIQLLDRLSLIDASSPCGEKPREGEYDSRVSFHDVTFSYPSRPNIEVLTGLKLSVRPGETLAIVGSSGCGKSTCLRLLERFYDPTYGTIYVDNYDIRLLNIKWLRRQFGIVAQEPVLFDRSISENIAYGDNGRNVLMTDVIAAARMVNIHGFIEKLPDGYHTSCGEKGELLSGGQKQLVAIARALVRNPKILLLDEATSALDAENERIVQEALDKARVGRTCIIIAHRLSTVRHADRIAVIHNGQVAELGTHHDLIAKRGVYYKLTKAQMAQTDE